MKYVCTKADGNTEIKDNMSLEEMQTFVGGYIEKVGNFYVNEDGLRLELPRNIVYGQFVGNVICIKE